jgi:hypothetical protein
VSRRTAVVLSVAAALLMAGCAPGANDELRSLVDGVAPHERDTIACEWESNWGSGEDDTDLYGCTWFARGEIGPVGRAIVTRAIAKGLTVYCDGEGKTLQLTGTSGPKRLWVEVLEDGFVTSDVVSPEEVDIPSGHVFVAIGAAEHASSSRPENLGPPCIG